MVTSAIQFLTSLSTGIHNPLFKEPDTLKMLCERIIIPNMKLRGKENRTKFLYLASLLLYNLSLTYLPRFSSLHISIEIDLELFEDNPIEYIRRDMEGSDNDTRRKAALELVKGLRKHYERETTSICSTYITAMLQVSSISISIFLSFYLSIFLSFYLSIFLSFYLSIFLSFYLSSSISLFSPLHLPFVRDIYALYL